MKKTQLKDISSDKKVSNNVYVNNDSRMRLESTILEIGYVRGKSLSASSMVAYLIDNYLILAKDEILKELQKK